MREKKPMSTRLVVALVEWLNTTTSYSWYDPVTIFKNMPERIRKEYKRRKYSRSFGQALSHATTMLPKYGWLVMERRKGEHGMEYKFSWTTEKVTGPKIEKMEKGLDFESRYALAAARTARNNVDPHRQFVADKDRPAITTSTVRKRILNILQDQPPFYPGATKKSMHDQLIDWLRELEG